MINLIKKLIRKKIYYKGPYKKWEIAKQKSTGYDSDEIFEKVKKSALIVKETKKGHERDSIIAYDNNFDKYLIRVLDGYSNNKDKIINILDFGGSLGSLYFKYKDKIKNKFIWSIIEQKKFVKEGKKNFQNNQLIFFNSINEYKKSFSPDIILASSSLQYLEKYQETLKEMINLDSDYIIILKTPFSKKKNNEIYIQKPLRHIYNSTYPSWIFNYEFFLNNFTHKFELVEKQITQPELFQLWYLNLYFKKKT